MKTITFTDNEENRILSMLDDMMHYWVFESGCADEYLGHIEAGAILYQKLGYDNDAEMFLKKAKEMH